MLISDWSSDVCSSDLAFVEHRVDPPRSYRANPIAAIRPAFGHDVELAIRARGATAPNFEVLDLDVVFGEHQVENATKRMVEVIRASRNPQGNLVLTYLAN